MIACTTDTASVSCWNDVPVQTACGRRFTSQRITLHDVFTPQRANVACTVGANSGFILIANSVEKPQARIAAMGVFLGP